MMAYQLPPPFPELALVPVLELVDVVVVAAASLQKLVNQLWIEDSP